MKRFPPRAFRAGAVALAGAICVALGATGVGLAANAAIAQTSSAPRPSLATKTAMTTKTAKGSDADPGLTVTPSEASVQAGQSARFCVSLTDRDVSKDVGPKGRKGPAPDPYGGLGASWARTLTVAGLPSGATATFANQPAGRPGVCVRLTIATTVRTRAGEYRLTVTAGQGRIRASARFELRIKGSKSGKAVAFTISGNLSTPLTPGLTVPLDLTLTNPNAGPIQVTGLTVTISGVDAAHAAGCPVATNFVVTQFSGDYTKVIVPGQGSVLLSATGAASAQLPQIGMLDTNFNQDGCLGAQLSLAYTGTAVSA